MSPLIWAGIPRLGWRAATSALVLANVAVFAAMVASGVSPILPTIDQLLGWGADFGPYTLHGQPWRMVTSCFVHAGPYHLASNMLFLWWFGRSMERMLGPSMTIAIYLLTGIGGELFSLAWHPLRVSVGASGAVFGIAGALIALFSYGPLKPPRKPLLYGRVIALTVFGFANGVMPGANNMAHLGGLITGLLLGICAARWLRTPSHRRSGMIATRLYEGAMALEYGQYETAIHQLQAYTARRPDDADGHILLGYALHQANRYEEACEEYKDTLALRPNDSVAEVNLAEIYTQQGRAIDAVALIEKHIPG
jgi:rhomboid protease GluP